MKRFVNQTSINTVNAEIIKKGYVLRASNAGPYMLYEKKRGEPDGRYISMFYNKTAAFDWAWKLITGVCTND